MRKKFAFTGPVTAPRWGVGLFAAGVVPFDSTDAADGSRVPDVS
jgi:hypothetical protein